MIDFGPIDELREVRRRLSEQCGNDVHRYAAMLREMAKGSTAKYITQPLLREPPTFPTSERAHDPAAESTDSVAAAPQTH